MPNAPTWLKPSVKGSSGAGLVGAIIGAGMAAFDGSESSFWLLLALVVVLSLLRGSFELTQFTQQLLDLHQFFQAARSLQKATEKDLKDDQLDKTLKAVDNL